MDKHIEHMARDSGVLDGDLIVCERHGFAYQADMTVTAKYDEDYLNKCQSYEGQEIANHINLGRVAMVARHAGENALTCDVGIGSGEFITRRPHTYGIDVNPAAMMWLKEHGLVARDLRFFMAFTFWDVIEHVPTPAEYLDQIRLDGWAFFSVPIFDDLKRIRESRHYRPGEHLYYWTKEGFERWLAMYGFELREHAMFEMTAGRDSIHSFAFRRLHCQPQ